MTEGSLELGSCGLHNLEYLVCSSAGKAVDLTVALRLKGRRCLPTGRQAPNPFFDWLELLENGEQLNWYTPLARWGCWHLLALSSPPVRPRTDLSVVPWLVQAILPVTDTPASGTELELNTIFLFVAGKP